MANFSFVTTDPVSCLKPGRSLQVRSHCMRGKNTRPDSRRSARERKKKDQEVTERECTWKQLARQGIHLGRRAPLVGRVISEQQSMKEDITTHFSPQRIVAPPQPLSHVQISSWTLVRVGDVTVRLEAKRLLLQAFAQNVCDQSVTPLDRCVNLGCIESLSFNDLFSDHAFLQSMLCFHYATRDSEVYCNDCRSSRAAVFHLANALSLLQEKIFRPGNYEDESIIYVIINLILVAALTGDWLAVAAHMRGLQKVIQLRGGWKFLVARPILHFKLDRLDLIWVLRSGEKPYFPAPVVRWDPVTTLPYQPLPDGLYKPPAKWDTRLATLFRDFQYIALRINRYRLVHARHNPASFQLQLSSFQSRLFALEDELGNPVEELVRLALLAFMTTTFRAPGRNISYDWIAAKIRDVYIKAESDLTFESTTVRIWVLMAAAFTSTGPSEPWMKEAWRDACRESCWEEARNRLLQVMWIELIHDRVGERIFRRLEDPTCDRLGTLEQFWT